MHNVKLVDHTQHRLSDLGTGRALVYQMHRMYGALYDVQECCTSRARCFPNPNL